VTSKLVSLRFLAAVVGGVLSAGGVAAAATGTLPLPRHDGPVLAAADPTTVPTSVPATVPSTDPTSTPTSTPTTVPPTSVPTTSTTLAPAAAPTGIDCPADVANHGAYVSSVARDRSLHGRDHGAAVSEAARSDCGRAVPSAPSTATTEPPTTLDGSGADVTGGAGHHGAASSNHAATARAGGHGRG